MPSDRVVEALDIVEYVGACCILSLVVLMMHLLFLQTRPETLHRRVVVAVATTTHRRLHAKLFEQGSIRAAGVLTATVAVVNEIAFALYIFFCHQQGINGALAV